MTQNHRPTRLFLKTTKLPVTKASTLVPKHTVKGGTGWSFSHTSQEDSICFTSSWNGKNEDLYTGHGNNTRLASLSPPPMPVAHTQTSPSSYLELLKVALKHKSESSSSWAAYEHRHKINHSSTRMPNMNWSQRWRFVDIPYPVLLGLANSRLLTPAIRLLESTRTTADKSLQPSSFTHLLQSHRLKI